MQIYTVSQLSNYIKALLNQDLHLGDLWVTGEVSSVKHHGSGHVYFTFKDSDSEIKAVMFRGNTANGAENLIDGSQVNIEGYVSYYEVRGQIQLYARSVMPVGAGELSTEFEKLRSQLQAEGLFDPSRKRSLPIYPKKIGVVTSASGAVIHDIVTILETRYPLTEIVFCPSSVQGDEAPVEIADGIKILQQIPDVEVIIVGRGGGSAEDLWAFNTEIVARSIYASQVPIVSAVGHETDTTIADFVADVRAATPTAAATICTPDKNILEQEINSFLFRSTNATLNSIDEAGSQISFFLEKMKRYLPDINAQRQKVDDILERVNLSFQSFLQIQKEKTKTQITALSSLNPDSVLKRGYAIVTTQNATPIMSTKSITTGSIVKTRLQDGEFESKVL
ncbi:MAG: exodeoxyribonuclease VII large subunit [Chloroflexi bacterium]|nr:exodeoxyribonuclease VII large subunit [Chloroflexota bacterium]